MKNEKRKINEYNKLRMSWYYRREELTATSATMEAVSLSNGSDKPKSSEIMDRVECKFTTTQLTTDVGNCQTNLNEGQVSSWNDWRQDMKDVSVDNMEESPLTTDVDIPTDEHLRYGRELLNRGGSDSIDLNHTRSNHNKV